MIKHRTSTSNSVTANVWVEISNVLITLITATNNVTIYIPSLDSREVLPTQFVFYFYSSNKQQY